VFECEPDCAKRPSEAHNLARQTFFQEEPMNVETALADLDHAVTAIESLMPPRRDNKFRRPDAYKRLDHLRSAADRLRRLTELPRPLDARCHDCGGDLIAETTEGRVLTRIACERCGAETQPAWAKGKRKDQAALAQ
jgi:hypothetical protein